MPALPPHRLVTTGDRTAVAQYRHTRGLEGEACMLLHACSALLPPVCHWTGIAVMEAQMSKLHLWYPENCPTDKRGQLRGIVKDSLSTLYVGWDDEYDRHFDKRSVWLERVGEDSHRETLALCRIIYKEYGPCAGPLPMEMGDISAYTPGRGRRVVEASGFWYSRREHALEMLGDVMDLLILERVDLGYLLFDPTNTVLRNLYLKTLGLHHVPDALVRFRTFTRPCGEIVQWHVATGGPREFDIARHKVRSR